jgi:ribonuclease G
VGDAGGGFILRTNGEDASDAELAEDIAYLRKTWPASGKPPPRCRRRRCCTRT